MEDTCNQVLHALKALRLSPALQESQLHAAIAAVLSDAQLSYTHEAVLAPRCRIDFLCEGIGIEVKRGRPARGVLLSQLRRYAACDAVSALILVIERTANLPATLLGKPLYVISLNRLWGVSLP